MPPNTVAFRLVVKRVSSFVESKRHCGGLSRTRAPIIVTCMNHPFKIKICGVTTSKDAQMVAASRADAIGLNFYAPGKRFVDVATAESIVAVLSESQSALVTVGVFVNDEVENILNISATLGLHSVQLHGDESPDFLRRLIRGAEDRGLKLDFIRAIRTLPSNDQAAMDLKEIETEINRWTDAGVDAILIDAAVAGDFGGTGKQVDWDGFSKLSSPVPKILAGGLTPDNLGSAIRTAQPAAVDVASGVETDPRHKSQSKTESFAATAHKLL